MKSQICYAKDADAMSQMYKLATVSASPINFINNGK